MGILTSDLRSNKVDSLTTQLIDFHSRRITNAADAVDQQDYVTLAQLNAAIEKIKPVVNNNNSVTNSTTTVTATAVVDSHTLTVATTNIVASVLPAPADGMLVVIIKQDATGGRHITWDASSFINGPTSINIIANGVSVVTFVADSGKWRMAAPMIG